MMIIVKKLFVLLYHLFTDPVCNINIPWELPIPYWMMGLFVLYDLGRGTITTPKELVWIIVQLIIATRVEFLLVALLVPLLLGKHATWCKSSEYGWGMAVLFMRVAYIMANVSVQLHGVSQQCIGRLQAVTNARFYQYK